MASIRDVAEFCGVSVSTISRVINNQQGVHTETRRRVIDAIDRLGYRPNLVAQGLRAKRGRLIGLVVPDDSISFSSLMHYTMLHARERGYGVIFGTTQDDPEIEAEFIDGLIQRQIDGIVFSRVSDESRVSDRLRDLGVPAVIVDRTTGLEHVPTVALDNYKAGMLAGEFLAELGHTSIACVQGPPNIAIVRERLRGFRAGLEKYGRLLPDRAVFTGSFKYDSGAEAFRRIHQSMPDVTAIWAMNDLMAYGVIREAAVNGIAVPDDISVLGMDDIKFSEMLSPPLSTIHYPFDEMAQFAIDRLVERIEWIDSHNQDQPKELLEQYWEIQPSVVSRGSCTRVESGQTTARA